jgi:hypothetical protein
MRRARKLLRRAAQVEATAARQEAEADSLLTRLDDLGDDAEVSPELAAAARDYVARCKRLEREGRRLDRLVAGWRRSRLAAPLLMRRCLPRHERRRTARRRVRRAARVAAEPPPPPPRRRSPRPRGVAS